MTKEFGDFVDLFSPPPGARKWKETAPHQRANSSAATFCGITRWPRARRRSTLTCPPPLALPHFEDLTGKPRHLLLRVIGEEDLVAQLPAVLAKELFQGDPVRPGQGLPSELDVKAA